MQQLKAARMQCLSLMQSMDAHPAAAADVADWRDGSREAWRPARRLSYPAVAAESGAFLIGKSDYFISRQTAGGV